MNEVYLNVIIGIVILLQIVVFARNINRISTYGESIGRVGNYTIKHSSIPQEHIDNISAVEILSNRIPEGFKSSEVHDDSYEVEEMDSN